MLFVLALLGEALALPDLGSGNHGAIWGCLTSTKCCANVIGQWEAKLYQIPEAVSLDVTISEAKANAMNFNCIDRRPPRELPADQVRQIGYWELECPHMTVAVIKSNIIVIPEFKTWKVDQGFCLPFEPHKGVMKRIQQTRWEWDEVLKCTEELKAGFNEKAIAWITDTHNRPIKTEIQIHGIGASNTKTPQAIHYASMDAQKDVKYYACARIIKRKPLNLHFALVPVTDTLFD